MGRLCAGWGQGAGRVREVRGPKCPRPTAHPVLVAATLTLTLALALALTLTLTSAHPVLVAVAVLEDELGVVVSDLDTRRHVTCQVRGPG